MNNMIDCWQKYTGDVVCGEKISHQHLSNIYYYTHFTMKGFYPNRIRNDVKKSLNERFDGKILPYQPDPKFQFEFERLKRLGWLRPNGTIVIWENGKCIYLGKYSFNEKS